MSDGHKPANRSGMRRRQVRYALSSAVLALVVTVSCVLAVFVAGRLGFRVDATARGDHSLAPRTVALIEGLDGPVELVISANLSGLDRAAQQRLLDVLTTFEERSKLVDVLVIDTGSAAAVGQYADLVERVATQHAQDVELHSEAIGRTAQDLAQLGEDLRAAARALRTWIGSEGVGEVAGVLEALATEAQATGEQITALRATIFGATPLPESDTALERAAGVVTRADEVLVAVTRSLGGQGAQVDSAPPLEDAIERARQTGATAVDRLDRLGRLDPLVVARLLRQQETFLVVASDGLSVVDFDSLFPAAGVSETGAVSLRFAGEEPIASAIVAATRPSRTTVVFVHGENERLLAESGRVHASAPFVRLIDRLRRGGMLVTEWATTIDEATPSKTTVTEGRGGPVVWFVLGAPPMSTAGGTQGGAMLGAAIAKLIDAGENLFVSVGVSELPAVGEADPIATALAKLGVSADSGRLLIRRTSTPSGPGIETRHELRRAEAGSPISSALDGLATMLPGATQIDRTADAEGVEVFPILRIENDESVWAETRWRSAGGSAPSPDPQRDDATGPWTVVAAVERDRGVLASGGAEEFQTIAQRAIIVGSSLWYIDQVTEARGMVDGRSAEVWPGNRELIDAGMLWLTGEDGLIAASAGSREVARIMPLSRGQLSAIRWLLIAGLPSAVLGTGLVVRLLRR